MQFGAVIGANISASEVCAAVVQIERHLENESGYENHWT
jgi:hypothetical protein